MLAQFEAANSAIAALFTFEVSDDLMEQLPPFSDRGFNYGRQVTL